MRTVLLLAASAMILAGCSDAPPSGEFALGSSNVQAEGTATIDYQEFHDPLGVPDPLDPARCAQDQVPATPPDQRCVYPYSRYEINITLPAPDPAMPYIAFFNNNTGAGDIQIGQLVPAGDMFSTQNTFQVDMSAPGSIVEIRMGEVVVATASGNEGSNPFETAVGGVTGDATYRGREITVNVAGIPDNATAVGRLYEEGSMEPAETFPVTNGENVFEASRNIAAYSEFHIHLGSSGIALTEAMIE